MLDQIFKINASILNLQYQMTYMPTSTKGSDLCKSS